MAVHLVHGMIDDWSPALRMHRLYVPAPRFKEYLEQRPAKYCDWTPNAEHDVLTVDDSTNAAAAACVAARALGHAVTLFVNPHQIITERPYFFSYLDMYIDTRSCSVFSYRARAFDLTIPSQIPAFRSVARAHLMRMEESARNEELDVIASLTGAPRASVPHFAKPLTLTTLLDLHERGVRIQNHGWSHMDIAALSDSEFARDFGDTQDWIHRLTSTVSTLYAVPFGFTRVAPPRRASMSSACLLADSRTPLGILGDGHINRSDITSQFQDTAR